MVLQDSVRVLGGTPAVLATCRIRIRQWARMGHVASTTGVNVFTRSMPHIAGRPHHAPPNCILILYESLEATRGYVANKRLIHRLFRVA